MKKTKKQKKNIALPQDSVKVYERDFCSHVSANPVSLIMTAALTAPRQWALLGDVVVVETRVWPNEALVTV